MAKFVTLQQTQTVANGVLAKVRAKGYAVAEDLGALASKDEVAKSDLASTLVAELEGKADTADLGALATKDEVAESDLATALAGKINGKADSATTLAGYGITDAYTKSEVDNAIDEAQQSTYKPGGSLTAAQIQSALLVAGNEGKVYNATEDFVTTSDFVEGAGKSMPAGTNIAVVDVDTTGETPTFKFDTQAGAYGVATHSGNGLMSASDKTKLDGADVDPYTGTGAIGVANHQISISPATTSAAGSMSAEDKAKLDGADVTAYTGTGAISIENHVVSVDAASASTSGAGGNAGTMSAADKEKLDNIEAATDAEVTAMVAALDNL